MGYFLFQTTNFVTEKLHEYFIFFRKLQQISQGNWEKKTFYIQQDRFILLAILPVKIVGYFLFQTTSFVTGKLHEYFRFSFFFQKPADEQIQPVATLFPWLICCSFLKKIKYSWKLQNLSETENNTELIPGNKKLVNKNRHPQVLVHHEYQFLFQFRDLN